MAESLPSSDTESAPTRAAFLLLVSSDAAGETTMQVKQYYSASQSQRGEGTASPKGRKDGDEPPVVRIAGRDVWPSQALTTREGEIAALVAHGMTNVEIARVTYLSMTTVKFHVGNLLTKIGLRNRVELSAYVWQAGLDHHAERFLHDPKATCISVHRAI